MNAAGVPQQLLAALARLQVLELEAVHRLEQDAPLPAFKGFLWHAVFGARLHAASADAFGALMGAGPSLRPWVLEPPLDLRTRLPQGSELRWRIRLFGDEVRHAEACMAAMRAFGEDGLGEPRSHASLQALACRTIDVRGLAAGAGAAAAPLQLRLATPLAIRADGRVQQEPPTLPVLLQRVFARVARLAPRMPQGLFAQGERELLLQRAQASPCEWSDLDWVALTRRSARQQRAMPFAGWRGALRFPAPASALQPWFELARVLQVGARTTFGFGVIDIDR